MKRQFGTPPTRTSKKAGRGVTPPSSTTTAERRGGSPPPPSTTTAERRGGHPLQHHFSDEPVMTSNDVIDGIVTRELTGSGAKPSHHRLQHLRVKRPHACLCTTSRETAALRVTLPNTWEVAWHTFWWCKGTHGGIVKRELVSNGAKPSHHRLQHLIEFH